MFTSILVTENGAVKIQCAKIPAWLATQLEILKNDFKCVDLYHTMVALQAQAYPWLYHVWGSTSDGAFIVVVPNDEQIDLDNCHIFANIFGATVSILKGRTSYAIEFRPKREEVAA